MAVFRRFRAALIAPIAYAGLFCGATIGATAADMAKVRQINAEVNRSIHYRPDYGGDKWSLTGRYGDCEDYALRKVLILARHGIKAEIGYYFLPGGIGHAIAIVDGMALDNRSDRIDAAPALYWRGVLRGNAVWTTHAMGKPAPFVKFRDVE